MLGYEEKPLVSTDYINDTRSGIVDALSTMVVDGTHLKARSSVFTPVPVRPRRRGERRSLRTFSPGSRLSPPRVPRFQSRHTSTPFNSTVQLYVWYDNEYGYSARMADIANMLVEKGM